MKNIRNRSIIIFFITVFFICGIFFFIHQFINNANFWAMSPANKHFSETNLSCYGKILDRNDTILAYSEENKRIYHQDPNVRKAVLHTVGDNNSHIATSIQNLFRDELSNYNFIFGVNTPDFLKQNKNIKLTIDSNICKYALSTLTPYKGAICIYNYKTGEIICMVSSPTFDPYHPEVIFNDKTGFYEGAYINRAISASYAPGSVFKIVTTAAGLDNFDDLDFKTYSCQQTKFINNKKISCMGSHHNINLKNAMMKSCNIYFADLAVDLGKNAMTKTANLLCFNRTFKFDRIETKKSYYNVQTADDYDLGWSGVGQYNNLLNPMHSLILMGAIANSGTAVLPHIIMNIYTDNSFNTQDYLKNLSYESLLNENTANKIKEFMRYNVTENYGESMFAGLNVCAKTGTAEVGDNKKPHGWMVGFSDNAKTPLAFSVIVENSGFGSQFAGPIASKVLKFAVQSLK